MPIQIIPTTFEIEGLPQYVAIGDETYEMERVNRIKDHAGSSIIIIYREKQ